MAFIAAMKNEKLRPIKAIIAKLLKSRGIARAGIFGSAARGEQGHRSDIDVVVEFNGGLLELVRLERELQGLLGRKVDLVTYNEITPLLKKRILDEEVRIL